MHDLSNEDLSMSSNQGSELQNQSDAEDKELTNEQRIEQIKKEIFGRETPAKYKPIIGEKVFIEIGTKYADNLINMLRRNNELTELGRTIAKEIEGGNVLDLGCGASHWLNTFSQDNGANLYIGVDLSPFIFQPKVLEWRNPTEEEEEAKWLALEMPSELAIEEICEEEKAESSRIPKEPEYKIEDRGLQVKDDMLRAISTIKSGSIKLVIASGIETHSGSRTEADRDNTGKYLTALKDEIKRVLTEDGLFLNYESTLSLEGSSKVEVGGYMDGVSLRRNNKTSEEA